MVHEVWNRPTTDTEAFHRLGHKLFQTGRELKKWSKNIISDARLKLLMTQEVILRLDEAQDFRELTLAESELHRKLKHTVLGWAVLERARRKQSSCVNYLREGDVNTRFFHLKANARRQKNIIHRLRNGQGWAVTHEDKQPLVEDHFQRTMEQPQDRTKDFCWDALQLKPWISHLWMSHSLNRKSSAPSGNYQRTRHRAPIDSQDCYSRSAGTSLKRT